MDEGNKPPTLSKLGVRMSEWSRRVEGLLRLGPDKDAVLGLIRRATDGRSHIIVSSVGHFSSAGRYLAQLVNSLTSSSAFYVEPHELMYYVAPYNEGREADALLVSTPGGTNDLYLLLDQLTLTGHRVALISEPLPEIIKRRFSGIDAAEVPWNDMGALRLLALLAYSVSSIGRRELHVRTRRILDECLSLASVADELVERYDRELGVIGEALSEPYVVTYTPTLEPAAELVALGLSRGPAVAVELQRAYLYVGRVFSKVLAFTTDVEAHVLRYYLNKVVERGGSVGEVRLRTDPLTAPLYALLLVYYAAAVR